MVRHMLAGLNERIRQLEMLICVALLLVIVATTGIGVIMRYGFGSPLIWGSDLAILAMIWLVFVGAAAIYRRNGHLSASSLPAVLPGRAGATLRVTVTLTVVGCAIVMGWFGVNAAMTQHTQFITSLRLPRSLYSMPIVWAAISLTLASLTRLFEPQGRAATSDI